MHMRTMNAQPRNKRRALVTGGAGFLGSHLCDGLLGEGYTVVAADNLLTGRLGNIEHLRNDSRFEFVEKDVCQPGEWGTLDLDYVFHFASPASPVDYAEHGIATLRVGSYGTFEALETALRGENLTVYGDGSQTRSFCYVSDEVDGILRLARSAEHEPVNVGNPTEFTILECARKVIATTGSASQIKFEALPQDDPKQRCPDISKAKRLLGWEPKVDLESGLKLSLEYFRRAVAKKEQPA